MSHPIDRRTCLALFAASGATLAAGADAKSRFQLATFTADVTVPVGHGMMGGSWKSTKIADPLEAHGVVLLGGERPIVVVAVVPVPAVVRIPFTWTRSPTFKSENWYWVLP